MHDLFGILKKKKYKYALQYIGMVLHYIIQIQHDRSTLSLTELGRVQKGVAFMIKLIIHMEHDKYKIKMMTGSEFNSFKVFIYSRPLWQKLDISTIYVLLLAFSLFCC